MGVGSDFTKGAQYSRNEMITARNRFERERDPAWASTRRKITGSTFPTRSFALSGRANADPWDLP